MKTLGHYAYEAYLDFSGGMSLITGDRLPEWEAIQEPQVQHAWEHVAQIVRTQVLQQQRLEAFGSQQPPEAD